MRQLTLSLIAFVCAVSAASADIYQFTVNTSSIAGTSGSIDFQFNPGPLITQAASLQISGFAGNGHLTGSPVLTGVVSGTLPASVTFDNVPGFNDYFEDYIFGTKLSFEANLYGPAVSAPNGASTSGSTFAFSMFSDPSGTVPALTTDTTYGIASTVDINLDGTTTVSNFSLETTIAPAAETPEPGMYVPLGICLAGLFLVARRRWTPQAKHRG